MDPGRIQFLIGGWRDSELQGLSCSAWVLASVESWLGWGRGAGSGERGDPSAVPGFSDRYPHTHSSPHSHTLFLRSKALEPSHCRRAPPLARPEGGHVRSGRRLRPFCSPRKEVRIRALVCSYHSGRTIQHYQQAKGRHVEKLLNI